MASPKFELKRVFAGLPKTERGKPIVIKGDPKGKSYTYVNGNSVFIRNIEDPSECDVYTQHAKDTTVACFAPSGFYMCSADITGKVRIWDLTQKEHLLKYEYQPISGAIKDIVWTEDSKRIAVCGEGRSKYGAAFLWDSGSSCGDLSGPSKSCNSIDIKQNRPYRLILASEDYTSYFCEGPPFKMKNINSQHTNFVNVCRYSPDGSKFVTGGADGKAFIYDGKTGELLGEMNEPAGRIHKGGVYGMAWSPDSKKLLTCSADKTAKIWNMEEKHYISNKEEVVFTFGTNIEDMQVTCAWIGETLITVSLSGKINYLDVENPNKPKKIIEGHSKAIIASCLNDDKSLMFTSSFDGAICCWDLKTGEAQLITGKGHSSQVSYLYAKGDTLYSCGIDDTLRFISIPDRKYKDDCVKLASQPQSMAVGNLGLVVIACLNEINCVQDGKITHTYKNSDPNVSNCSVALNDDLGKVCIGDEDGKVTVFDLKGDELVPGESFPCNSKVTDLSFSPCNTYIGAATAKKQVKVVNTSDFKTVKQSWTTHSVKVNSLSWAPDSKHIASSGTDGHIFIYNLEESQQPTQIRGAHAQSVDVTSIQFKDSNTLLSTGRQDCSIRVWDINI